MRPPDRIFHYGPPENTEGIEPLIRPICERINQSGWLWTVESCEGHTEDYQGSWWGFPNPDPMLRFGCRTEHVGHLILLLKRATATVAPMSVPEMYPGAAPDEEWSDLLTYIRGQDGRDQRRLVYARLAELAHSTLPSQMM